MQLTALFAVQSLCVPGGHRVPRATAFLQAGKKPRWWVFAIGKISVLDCHLFLFELSLESRVENCIANSTTVQITAGFFPHLP